MNLSNRKWQYQNYAKVPLLGLCHGVVGNAKRILFRSEIMKHTGYFTTESDRHIVEYVPWFQHIDKSILKPYVDITMNIKNKRHHWYEDMGVTIDQADSFDLTLSHESASGIIEGMVKGKPYTFSGNVINKGYIENLPNGICVEVPCTADRNGIHPHTVGRLPTICAALNMTNINEQQLLIEAIIEQDRNKAFQALLLDPVTQAKLSMKQTKVYLRKCGKGKSS
jgi:alpha-galactosidase